MSAALRPLLLASLLLPAVAARAQSVQWDPPGGSLAVGQSTEIQLVFQDCEPKGNPTLPDVAGLDLEYSGRTNNISWVNGEYSSSITLSYNALLTERRVVKIPPFDVATSKGRLLVPAAQFEPGTATVGGTGQPLESAADSRLQVMPSTVWAGQVFGLDYSIEAERDYYADFDRGAFQWNAASLTAEDWSAPEPFDIAAGSEPRSGLAYHTRAIARTPGRLQLNPVSQIVNLSVGVTGFGFFQQRQYQRFAVTSNAPVLEVRPLPPAPAGFGGAVGKFKLTSEVVPTAAAVGEPITWTLKLEGTGNWPDIAALPPRRVSKDFQVIEPRAKRTPAPGKLFDASLAEDVVLVPTRPGRYRLGSVAFVYFDPAAGVYRTLRTAPVTVAVTGGPGAAAGAVAGLSGPNPAGSAPVAGSAPAAELPRDPLAESGAWALQPWADGAAAALALAPFGLLLLFWLALARRRARQTDPSRPRREARERLVATLGRIAAGQKGRGQLLAWQQDAAVLLGLEHAAPSPRQVLSARAAGDWARLWDEADRALYGPNGALPEDWITRAGAALASTPPPPFRSRRLFLARNLFPFLLAGLAAAFCIAPRARAEEAAAYRQGDFPGAERLWRESLRRHPADWAARYDLSLALAQQDRWDEAAAYAAAALVEKPDDDAVRWQFALASSRAGFAPEPLAGFVQPGLTEDFASLASAPEWQVAMVGAALLAAAALALALAESYRPRPRRPALYWALGGFVAGVVLFFAALAGRQAYGEAGDPRAVVIWRRGVLRSIPTEAEVGQKTVALAPGAVATADKAFLGWVRLSFANGETGWVRREETVPLWGGG